MERRIELGGKYTLIFNEATGEFKALRYGEPWRNLAGDKLILTLMYKLQQAEDLLREAYNLLDDDCYGYDEVHSAITRYLNGEGN
jgi:hypothetical protein